MVELHPPLQEVISLNPDNLLVRRIPRNVDTEGLRKFMSRFGEVEDCLVLKERIIGWHRGYGFVTFASVEDAKAALAFKHFLGSRNLEVTSAKPKDEDARKPSRGMQGQYGVHNPYIAPVTSYAALGASMKYDYPGSAYGSKIPREASAEYLHQYFGKFGQVTNVYILKDPKKPVHRGFGFVTFAEDGVADHVFQQTHEILGQEVAIDSITSFDDSVASDGYMEAVGSYGGYGGPMRFAYSQLYGSLDFNDVRIDSAMPRADSGANCSYMEDVGSYGGYGGPMHNAYSRGHESLDFIDWSYRGSSSNNGNSRLSHMDDWRPSGSSENESCQHSG
ncbi:Heterogeneous nuclear ribonucleoprotein 1 [Acorus calamus]|uniref:Heterogeneous nuclear ribonucleoprotein 1 n=1 Tax=Acorus calamus TaxID=4465 RepID=A0AAV9EMW8_ACOCL|nr:Heterogeneous nuclear ribonucleoprotein 1 [Acorus calamus]